MILIDFVITQWLKRMELVCTRSTFNYLKCIHLSKYDL